MIKNFDILVLSPSEWKDNAVSNMHISAILSDCNNVLYIETMGGRLPKISEFFRVISRLKRIFFGLKGKKKFSGLNPKKVKIFSPLAIPKHGNKIIDYINNKLLTLQVFRFLKHRKFNKLIIWSFSPRWHNLVNELDRDLYIFHCVDSLITYDKSKYFINQFQDTVRNAELVFTPGLLLEKELKSINNNVFRINHGCSIDHLEDINKNYVVNEINDIPGHKVIYVGTIANWLDYDLIDYTVEKLSDVSFIFIGYIHAFAPAEKVKRLKNKKNVYFLGYKNFDELKNYYSKVDIGIIPYDSSNKHIQYSTPTKILDYLAAGLPVVSTSFPATLNLKNLVKSTNSPEEFSNAIQTYLKTGYEDNIVNNRKIFAQNNTWLKQVNRISSIISTKININKTF